MLEKKRKCTRCFRALGDGTRILIMREIKQRPMNVCAVSSLVNLTQPTVTHHLQKLHSIGFIERKKQGREVFYSLNKQFPCKGCGVLTFQQRT